MTDPLPTYTDLSCSLRDLSWARAQANAYRIDAQDYFKVATRVVAHNPVRFEVEARTYFERAMVKCARLAATNAQIRELEKSAHE